MNLRLLSYNIRFGGVGREAAIAEVIEAVEPDLVIFQEATHPAVIKEISEATGLPHWAAERGHSLAYLSRLPVRHHKWHHPKGSKHAFLEVKLEGIDLTFFGLHLRAQFSKWSERRRAREMRALIEGIEAERERFHVLLGDFNTLAPGEVLEVWRMPAWIQAMIWLSGREIQRETIGVVLKEGYIDGYRFLHKEGGATFPVWDPHLRLDYLFIPFAYVECLKKIEVIHDLPIVDTASDHYPLLALLDSSNHLRER